VGIVAAIVIVVLALTLPELTKVKTQRGDKVNINYIGTYVKNDTVFDSGTLPDTVIGSNGLLDYFDQQLIGIEPGVKKTFVIPAEFGYQAGMGHDNMIGLDMRFEITITKVTRDDAVLYPKPES
jgi:FKBP-type peptidyl-prolyl cis-trans isomerase (trigger factor)